MRHFGLMAALLAVCLAGCGEESGPELVSVSGRVTLGGGTWPAGGTLTFAPLEASADAPKLPGWAEFDADGNFVARCTQGEGLVPGKYVVQVVCAADGTHDAVSRSVIAPTYQQRPHQIVVEDGSALELDIPKS